MMTAEYAIEKSALEEHNLAITIRMPVQEWRMFLRHTGEPEADRGAPSEARTLAIIVRRALDEYDKRTSGMFSIGEYFTREVSSVDHTESEPV